MKKEDGRRNASHDLKLHNSFEHGARPVLELDIEYYQPYLDDLNYPESKRQEFLEVLWGIMVTFVDMGFGVEATQQAMQSIRAIEAASQEDDDETASMRLLTSVFEETSHHPQKEETEEEVDFEIR